MSFKTKEAAAARAAIVLRKMKTKGWKIRVWDNMGWHFDLHKGPLQLNESHPAVGKPYYFCLVDTSNDAKGGLAMWTEPETYKLPGSADPNTCVERAVKYAYGVVAGLYQVLKPAFESCGLKMPPVKP